jgi:hypothetical protein
MRKKIKDSSDINVYEKEKIKVKKKTFFIKKQEIR